MIHSIKGFSVVNEAEVDFFFSGIPLLFLWPSGCWQFYVWFLCLFYIQFVYLDALSSYTVEAYLEGFWALLLLACSVVSHSVVSNSLWPRGWQHARLPCPSPSPGACSNSCALSRWCHPTISYSVVPFSSAFNLSLHEGLFQGISSSNQVAKVLEFQL